MEKIISIVIPTLNRKDYLLFTLQHFIPQVERNIDKVELIVCNNSSDDDTDVYMQQLVIEYPFINYFYFKERAELAGSFPRSIAKASGKYVILWGDDDIPVPYIIEILLDTIQKYPGVGLIHFNRLIGYEDGNPMKNMTVYNNFYNTEIDLYQNISDFIHNHFWGATFMSSNLFLMSSWKEGLSYDTSSHHGFEFMGKIYYGVRNLSSLYISYPLCIQRKVANRSWSDKWPQYALLGIPNMAKDLERDKIFNDGLKVWNEKNNTFTLFCYILLSASTRKKMYKPLCKKINEYQNSKLRKILTYFVIYCTPGFVYNLSRKVLFNKKK